MYADFDWTTAPLSAHQTPILAGIGYVILILVILPKLVPEGGFQGLKPLFVFHNYFLAAWSLLMFCGCLWEMYNRGSQEGSMNWFICEPNLPIKGKGPLYFWSYIFYVSKYYEMVDTVLALLKGSRPPHFALHVYHHACVPLVVWNWLEYRQTLQFGGLLFNTGVHVLMYSYYGMKLLGIPTPWKSWVTRMQILQFVTSLVLLAITLKEVEGDLVSDKCAGMRCIWVNAIFNVTLLWQFVGVLKTPAKKKV
mmetsp:Transcript_30581/g.65940  ORF Transcript_30581/g.65940 Transcript_30581/m.65940 type:complete len:251 (+) Transcript_30581:313-1065(+)